MQSISKEVKEYDRLFDADNFSAGDIQTLLEAGNNEGFATVLSALKVGYYRGYTTAADEVLLRKIDARAKER